MNSHPIKVDDLTGLANFLRGCVSQKNEYDNRKR